MSDRALQSKNLTLSSNIPHWEWQLIDLKCTGNPFSLNEGDVLRCECDSEWILEPWCHTGAIMKCNHLGKTSAKLWKRRRRI